MKIKISDLVIKIINREEMPKKVLFNGDIYEWCCDDGDYRKDGWGSCLMIKDVFDNFGKYGSFYNMLFEDVEIIEEPKKIEKLNTNIINANRYDYDKNKEMTISNIAVDILSISKVVNELIDEINNLKEK